jgi:hypothetical protein
MFIGHVAVGLASKRFAPAASLGVLVAAPWALDLLWPFFLLAGWEKVRIDPGNTAFSPLDFVSYPYSHSLAMAALWAALFGFVYWAFTRYANGAMVVSVGVLSHWFLDAVVHRPDLPLFPGNPIRVGLGLWNSVPGTMAVESALLVIGVWLYMGATRPRDRIGTYGFWTFIGFLLLSYLSNIFGPPPPSERFLAWFSFALWTFPLWALWFDRHREPVASEPVEP